MGEMSDLIEELSTGGLHHFAEPLDPAMPMVAAGCYTIWDKEGRYLYAGMAGRSMTAESIAAARAKPDGRSRGLRQRLGAHRTGRRSGDQFCIYVFDFLVLPQLGREDVQAVTERRRRLDNDVRSYIAHHLSYRWAETPDSPFAFELERQLVGSGIRGRLPYLNPLRIETG